MDISKECNLFLNDVYSYDISACHYNILKKMNFNVNQINFDDKFERNKFIGKMERENPKLSAILRQTTKSLIDEYLLRNKIKKDEIIVRQYDGFYSTRPLKQTTSLYLPIELKEVLSIFIISIDRQKFITTDGNTYIIKGISNRFEEIDNIYKKILKINFANKKNIFSQLHQIQNLILTSTDPKLYCIPTKNNTFNIFLKKHGQFEISENLVRYIDTSEIDTTRYFHHYFQDFFDSITLHFI